MKYVSQTVPRSDSEYLSDLLTEARRDETSAEDIRAIADIFAETNVGKLHSLIRDFSDILDVPKIERKVVENQDLETITYFMGFPNVSSSRMLDFLEDNPELEAIRLATLEELTDLAYEVDDIDMFRVAKMMLRVNEPEIEKFAIFSVSNLIRVNPNRFTDEQKAELLSGVAL